MAITGFKQLRVEATYENKTNIIWQIEGFKAQCYNQNTPLTKYPMFFFLIEYHAYSSHSHLITIEHANNVFSHISLEVDTELFMNSCLYYLCVYLTVFRCNYPTDMQKAPFVSNISFYLK